MHREGGGGEGRRGGGVCNIFYISTWPFKEQTRHTNYARLGIGLALKLGGKTLAVKPLQLMILFAILLSSLET